MGIIIVHVNKSEGWRHSAYAYGAPEVPNLEGFHSEAYVCGEVLPRYLVPATIKVDLADSAQKATFMIDLYYMTGGRP